MVHEELMNEVTKLAREAVQARFEGGLHADKVRKQAYFDGYVRALRDAGLLSDRQALDVVTRERRAA